MNLKTGGRVSIIYFLLLGVWIFSVISIGYWKVKKGLLPLNSHGEERRVSLEEILAGMIEMEGDPSLQITPTQAKQILPIISPLEGYADVIHNFEVAVLDCLSPEQVRYIVENMGKPIKGDKRYKSLEGEERLLFFANMMGDEGDGGINRHYKNENWMYGKPTIMDVCEGLYRLKVDGKLTEDQASYLGSFLRNLAYQWGKMDRKKEEIRDKLEKILTKQQIDHIRKLSLNPSPDYIKLNLKSIMKFLEERSKQNLPQKGKNS